MAKGSVSYVHILYVSFLVVLLPCSAPSSAPSHSELIIPGMYFIYNGVVPK